MAFECLLVSRDPNVVCPVNHTLDDLSIATRVCLSPSKARQELAGGTADLVVIDWDDAGPACELLADIHKTDIIRKKTVVAVSDYDRAIPGIHLLLTKPVTAESSMKCLKNAYARMLHDYRRHARFAVMIPVIATGKDNQLFPITVTNIGDGGVGLSTREPLAPGDLVSFRILLPDARRAIYIEARVVWAREYGAAGCEFVRIPPVDLDILNSFLRDKCEIKKPILPL